MRMISRCGYTVPNIKNYSTSNILLAKLLAEIAYPTSSPLKTWPSENVISLNNQTIKFQTKHYL